MLKDDELFQRVCTPTKQTRNDPRKDYLWEMAQNDIETFHIDENKFTISSKNQAKHKRTNTYQGFHRPKNPTIKPF